MARIREGEHESVGDQSLRRRLGRGPPMVKTRKIENGTNKILGILYILFIQSKKNMSLDLRIRPRRTLVRAGSCVSEQRFSQNLRFELPGRA
jgi:hypothetical protein